ncbi:putative cell wall-binding protein [Mobiluncus mulieris]|uniref:N-acetylmuramoyl-L-alanine amidase LytC n=1 Tax=Mobiluncus mulieris TaxID=2052 RepID=A0A8G2M6V7_9ACTO|nr:cell wall-binding repeat-containing protein [Mobiluncus mulieris]MBB5846710.1 putative cell wall-binding protein [Mobiluncus mulieris]STO16819.1 N-acetylmuramoyl-L-alanine amidase LytC precursor [Mobiluncus mulieris]
MKQHNQVLSKLGRAGLVALFATSLAFTGIAPADALVGEAAPESLAKSIARIEVPVQEEVEDLSVERPLEITPETIEWTCPSGYAPNVYPAGSNTKCYEITDTKPLTGVNCAAGYAKIGNPAQCYKLNDKSEKDIERNVVKAATYDCPEGYITNVKPVAKDTQCQRPGGKTKRTTMKVCSGVLIDEKTVVSLSQCLIPGDPYRHVVEGGEEVAKISQGSDPISGKIMGPAKITFGNNTLPGAEHTYWANTAQAEGATQLMAIRTDRPVAKADGIPATPVPDGSPLVSIGTDLTVSGWFEDPGTPAMRVAKAKAGLPYLVNYTRRDPRFMQDDWNDFKRAKKGFDDAASEKTIGKVSEPNVRKGFVIDNTPMSEDLDLGAPAFNKDNQLAGMYIGAGMFLDLGEDRAKQFLYTRAKATTDGPLTYPAVKSSPYETYQQMQKLVCKSPEELGDAVEGNKRPIVINRESIKETLGGDPKAKSSADNSVYTYSSALVCGDGADTASMTIGSAQAWAKIVDKELQAVMDDLQARSDKAIKNRDKALAERDQYNNSLEMMKKASAGFDPDAYDNCKKFYDQDTKTKKKDNAKRCLVEMGNNLPSQIINGIEETKGGSYIIPPLGKWLEDNLDSDGSTLKRHLEDDLIALTVKADSKTKNADLEQKKADKLGEEITKKNNLNLYRGGVNKQLTGLLVEALKVIEPAQTQWKAEADKSYEQFQKDYLEYEKILNDIDAAALAKDDFARQFSNEDCSNKLTEPDTKANAVVKEKCRGYAAKKSEQEKLIAALEKKRDGAPYQGWKHMKKGNKNTFTPDMTGYAPNHMGGKSGKPQDGSGQKLAEEASNALPKYLLYAQHLGRALQGIQGDLANKGFKDRATIEKIHKKIAAELQKAKQAERDALAAQSDINFTVKRIEEEFEKVPEALKNIAKDKLEAAQGFRRETSKVITSVNDGVAALEELERQSKNAPSTDVANGYEKDATYKSAQVQSSLDTAKTNASTVTELYKDMVRLANGEIPGVTEIDPETGKPKIKGQIEKEKAEKAERERKEKEEAEKKAKELQKAEADKKAKELQKAEEEKKKADDEAKKDEARLAKALSKNTLRAEGTDRVLTSIAAWKIGKFPGDSLVLVDGNIHADGLSATPFAAALKAPVLLTCWNTGLEPALMDQIKASGKKKLFLVGGQVPMTPYDEFELRDAGLDIFRIAGPDRYATSVAVNQATEPLIGAKPKKPINLYIGDGVGFPDALVAGAAAGRVGGLMLLSKGKQLDAQTYNYISNLGQTRPLKIIPVGGSATAAVKNTPWPTTMSINIAPIVGKDRYETAAKLATTLPGTRAAVLATGENFADALSGGSLAVDQNATLVLTRSQELPPASYQSLQRFGSEKTIVMGGKSAVSPKVAELINGATLKNTDTKTVLGTLLERKKLRDDKANQEAKERRNALSKVRGMIKDSNSLKDVMSQLGFGSIDDLTKLLNDFKAQQDKDKKPDAAKPELDKSSTTTGK